MTQRFVWTVLTGSLALLALTGLPRSLSGQQPSQAITPTTTTKLFDGRSLAHFDTWLVDEHTADPLGVFSVVDEVDGAPAIRISGQQWGGLLTKEAYRDYRLIVEYRWGGATWGERKARTRDSGVLLHAQGRPGNTEKDFNGPWLRSIEFQIIEGGVGDIILVSGYSNSGQPIRPSLTATTRTDRDGEDVYDPRGTPKVFSSGRINWWGRSEDWEDRLGMRGPKDVESPGLQWTRLEAVADGRNLRYFVNGTRVNAASEASVADGKIMLQAEGAEILFRRIDLEPLR
ncbi:MAG: 3-keto-disaccharide hydrolase [Vicinamibacteraceae bacterium]